MIVAMNVSEYDDDDDDNDVSSSWYIIPGILSASTGGGPDGVGRTSQ